MAAAGMRRTRTVRLIEIENGDRPIDELLREELARMNVRELSDKWGVHFTLIYEWMRQLDIPGPGRRSADLVGSK